MEGMDCFATGRGARHRRAVRPLDAVSHEVERVPRHGPFLLGRRHADRRRHRRLQSCAYEHSAFGIDPNDLEPCELPSPGEPLGSILTDEEFEQNIEALRVLIRPDLFVMGDDGIAKRKS
jgi:hypothetical protein